MKFRMVAICFDKVEKNLNEKRKIGLAQCHTFINKSVYHLITRNHARNHLEFDTNRKNKASLF